jgi:hypothetical protein
MPIYDERCTDDSCGHEQEVRRSYDADSPCERCGGSTRVFWKSVPHTSSACDPYDYLDGHIPASRPIKSFANDRRKGGKDTT